MKIIYLLLMTSLFVSCSTVRNTVVGLTSDVMHKGAYELETERSWEVFNDAIAGNLKMLEGLWYVDQDNEELLVDLTKGYSGYAFGIHETLYLDDLYKDNDSETHKNLAIYSYSKAVSYGMKFLEEKGIKQNDLLTKMKEDNGVVKLLEEELSDSDDDVQAVFYLGNALGGLINLQKKNMKMLSQLTIVKGMFDWACSKQADIQFGACEAFYGAYEAGRPKMLGGDIEKGKEFFLQAIKKHPTALLNRVMFIQFYVIPMSDEDIYEEQSSILKAEFEKFEKSKNWAHGFEGYGEKHAALLNAIAKKRFEIIEKNKDELF